MFKEILETTGRENLREKKSSETLDRHSVDVEIGHDVHHRHIINIR